MVDRAARPPRHPRSARAGGDERRCRATASSIRRWRAQAYDDRPLAIGYGQTISQPYMVARATELAAPRPNDRALEVGAGSGYQAAVLAELAAEVFAIEIVPALAGARGQVLAETGYHNVTVESFDGSGGWPEHAPYDVIIVSAGAPRIPAMLVVGAGGRGPAGDPGGRPKSKNWRSCAARATITSPPMTPVAATSICSAASASAAASRRPERRARSRRWPRSLRWACAGCHLPARGAACTRRARPARWYVDRAGRDAGGDRPRRRRAGRRISWRSTASPSRPTRAPGRLIFVLASPRRSRRPPVQRRAPCRRSPSRRAAPLRWPLATGRIIVGSPFGTREGRPHEGIDLPAPVGTPVFAAADGRVAYAGNGIRGYGNLIVRAARRRSADRLRAQLGAAGGAGAARARRRSHRAGRARAATRPVPTCISRCEPGRFPATRWDSSPTDAKGRL